MIGKQSRCTTLISLDGVHHHGKRWMRDIATSSVNTTTKTISRYFSMLRPLAASELCADIDKYEAWDVELKSLKRRNTCGRFISFYVLWQDICRDDRFGKNSISDIFRNLTWEMKIIKRLKVSLYQIISSSYTGLYISKKNSAISGSWIIFSFTVPWRKKIGNHVCTSYI